MSNSMILFDQQGGGGQLSRRFQALVKSGIGNDLGDGIKGSYGIISIKAGKFRIKYKGDEQVLMTVGQDGVTQVPVSYIDVVIVKANGFLNKQYFEGKYVEGSTAAPVCYSLDGVTPADASTKKQATTCALCPKNQFGSMVGDNGTKMKACRDTKKLAVVPLADIRNTALGGAMLFRVPPSSLKDLSAMADQLKGRGYPYNSVAVRISFDLDASHPKPTFKATRTLSDEEADQVLEMFESDSVLRVLADNDVVADHGEPTAAQPAPVQPAGVRPASPMPEPHETQPVPQQKPQLFGMPGSDPPVAVAGKTIEPKPAPIAEVAPAPRVLRVKPDDAPEVAPAVAQPVPVNPFAKAAPPASAPAPAAAAPPAKANPFAPPPGVAAPARKPEVIDSTAAEVVHDRAAELTQMETDINSILAGLNS